MNFEVINNIFKETSTIFAYLSKSKVYQINMNCHIGIKPATFLGITIKIGSYLLYPLLFSSSNKFLMIGYF